MRHHEEVIIRYRRLRIYKKYKKGKISYEKYVSLRKKLEKNIKDE